MSPLPSPRPESQDKQGGLGSISGFIHRLVYCRLSGLEEVAGNDFIQDDRDALDAVGDYEGPRARASMRVRASLRVRGSDRASE